MAYGIVATQGVVGSGGPGSIIFLADVSNASATASSKRVSLKWTDPEDVILNGVTLSAWSGTIVVRKEGSAPTSRTDGTVVLTSTSRNAYSTTGWVDTGLTNGTTYYYRFFPFNTDGNYTAGTSISAKPAPSMVTVPLISGTYTYSGSAQTPTISGFDENTMNKSGDLTETNAGNYNITISLKDDDHIWNDGTYSDKTFSWTINPEALTIPIVSGTLTYTGSSQSPTLNNYVSSKMTQSGDTSKTNTGNYTITIGLASTNYVFSERDASVRSIDLPWSINKATGAVSLSKNTTTLSSSKTIDTVTITKTGDGTLSVSSSNASLVTGSINGTTLTVTKAGNVNGTVTITVNAAASTNYTAASAQITITVSLVDPVLNNNNWATISTVAQAGTGDTYWDVGDVKMITLNGKVGSQLTLSNQSLGVFILHFNYPTNRTTAMKNIVFGGFKTAVTNGKDVCLRDAKNGNASTDGTICFNMSHKTTATSGNAQYGYNYGGWKGSDLRYDILGATSKAPSQYNTDKTTSNVGYDATESTLTSPKANTLLAAFPSDLRNVMRLWTRYVDNVGNSSNVDSNVTACVDAISLLAEFEIFGSRTYANQYEQNHQVQMSYYANGNSRVKYNHSNTGTSVNWWECSPYYSYSSIFCSVNDYGSSNYYTARSSYGVAPAFIV